MCSVMGFKFIPFLHGVSIKQFPHMTVIIVQLGIIELIDSLQVRLDPNPDEMVWIPKQTFKIT